MFGDCFFFFHLFVVVVVVIRFHLSNSLSKLNIIIFSKVQYFIIVIDYPAPRHLCCAEG